MIGTTQSLIVTENVILDNPMLNNVIIKNSNNYKIDKDNK